MSVDIASLVIEVDASQARTARQDLDALASSASATGGGLAKLVVECKAIGSAAAETASPLKNLEKTLATTLDWLGRLLSLVEAGALLRKWKPFTAAMAEFGKAIFGLTAIYQISGPVAAGAAVIGGAVRGLIGVLSGPAGLAMIAGAALGALAGEAAKTRKEVDALGVSVDDAGRIIQSTERYLHPATASVKGIGDDSFAAALGVKEFAGAVGDAAQKLYDLAAANKTNAINDTLAQAAKLRGQVAALSPKLPESRKKGIQETGVAITPASIWTHFSRRVSGDVASLMTGGRSDRDILKQVQAAQKAIGELDARTAKLMATPLPKFITPSDRAPPQQMTRGKPAARSASPQTAPAGPIDPLIAPQLLNIEKPTSELLKSAPIASTIKLVPDVDIDKYGDVLGKIKDLTEEHAKTLEQAFGRAGKAVVSITKAFTDYVDKRKDVEKKLSVIRDTDHDAEKDRAKLQNELAQAEVKRYGDIAGAAKGFFKEKSSGYQVMEKAEKAFRAIELAMSIKSMAQDAIETASSVAKSLMRGAADTGAGAAKMFSQLGIFAFPVVATMVATLVALGLKGIGGGKGGAVKVPTAEERQKSQGTGTVLGDASAKSDSIEKSLTLIEQHTNKELEFANPMLTALRSIDTSIGKVSDQLAGQLGRTGGLFDTSGLNLGKTSNMLMSGVPLLGGLFGSKTTRTLNDIGLDFGAQTLGDLKSGAVSGQGYQEVIEQTKKKFLGMTYSSKSKVSTTTSRLDDALQTSIADVFSGVYDAVEAGAEVLGVDGAGAMLDSFVLELGKVSLKDLKGAEISEALNAVFSAAADDIAAAAAPFITELRETGEGAFETLTRVAREYQVIDTTLASIGKIFGMVGLDSLTARDRLVDAIGGLDKLADGASAFAQAFLTEAERMAPVQKAVVAEMARLGFASVDTKDEFKELVLGLDLSTETGATLYAALMNVAPAFAKVADYAGQAEVAISSLTDAERRRIDETVATTVARHQADVERAARHSDRASSARRQREAEKAAAEATAAAWETLRDSVTAAVPDLLRAGDAMGALRELTRMAYADPAQASHLRDQGTFRDGSFNAGGFNAAFARVQADAAKELVVQMSAISIQIPNVVEQMQSLTAVAMVPFRGRGALNFSLGQDTPPGLYGALEAAQFVSQRDYRFGTYGADVSEYLSRRYDLEQGIAAARGPIDEYNAAYASINVGDIGANIDALNDRMTNGLSAAFVNASQRVNQFTQELSEMNAFVGDDFIAFTKDIDAQIRRIAEANRAVMLAAEAQVRSVFNQFTSGVAALDAAAQVAGEPLSQLAGVIGRMGSVAELLKDGLNYAREDFLGSGMASNARLVGQAASLAASVLATQEVRSTAAALGVSRDTAMLISGVRADDVTSFESAFLRLGDALGRGAITQTEYASLYNRGLDAFEGLVDATGRATDGLKDLTDQLKLDEQLSALTIPERLAEAARQFGAGPDDASARNLLPLLQQTARSEQDYRRLFDQVVRVVETGGSTSPRLGADGGMVENNDLLKALLVALEQVAVSSNKTARSLDNTSGDNGGAALSVVVVTP